MDKIFDKVQGGVKMFTGAGDAIRGNFNNAVDKAGDQVAGRPQGSVENRTGGHEDTAKKGLQDVKDGFDKVGSKVTSKEDGEHVQESSNVNK